MRRRIADEHRDPPIWHVKHRRGGLVDIEFIVQFLQLRDAAAKPEVLDVNTIDALAKLGAAGSIAQDVAGEFAAALTLWRDVQGLLKLTAEEPFDEARRDAGIARRCSRPAPARLTSPRSKRRWTRLPAALSRITRRSSPSRRRSNG